MRLPARPALRMSLMSPARPPSRPAACCCDRSPTLRSRSPFSPPSRLLPVAALPVALQACAPRTPTSSFSFSGIPVLERQTCQQQVVHTTCDCPAKQSEANHTGVYGSRVVCDVASAARCSLSLNLGVIVKEVAALRGALHAVINSLSATAVSALRVGRVGRGAAGAANSVISQRRHSIVHRFGDLLTLEAHVQVKQEDGLRSVHGRRLAGIT